MQLEQIQKLNPRKLYEFACDKESRIEFKKANIAPIERRRGKLLETAKTEKIYGANTGFGFLSEKQIPANQLSELQKRLIQSHSTGIGPRLPDEIVRAML